MEGTLSDGLGERETEEDERREEHDREDGPEPVGGMRRDVNVRDELRADDGVSALNLDLDLMPRETHGVLLEGVVACSLGEGDEVIHC